MSIMLSYIKDGVVYMATDTRVVDNGIKRNEVCESNFKIQKSKSGVLVGIVGDKVARQTVVANLDIFTLDKRGKLTSKHIAKEILPPLYSALKEGGRIKKKNGYPSSPVSLTLAHGGNMFEIYDNFFVCRCKTYIATGTASRYALARLVGMDKTADIDAQLVAALKNCEYYIPSVGAPFVTINTRDMKFTVTEG